MVTTLEFSTTLQHHGKGLIDIGMLKVGILPYRVCSEYSPSLLTTTISYLFILVVLSLLCLVLACHPPTPAPLTEVSSGTLCATLSVSGTLSRTFVRYTHPQVYSSTLSSTLSVNGLLFIRLLPLLYTHLSDLHPRS